MVVSNAVFADNTAQCWWDPQPQDKEKRYISLIPAATKTLSLAPIGGRMAYQNFSLRAVVGKANLFRCPVNIPTITYSFRIDAPLEDGYDDVYRTNIPGVGIRFVDGFLKKALPFEVSYINAIKNARYLPEPLNMELIRTARDVKTGTLNVNFKMIAKVQDWEAAEVNIIGSTELTSSNYFSGCTGEKHQDIPLGKVAIPLLGQQIPHTVGLNVLCTGLLPGSNLPVRIYFEGSNEGPGMLNLTPGGAEGIGVALTTPAGGKLPFSKFGALTMKWIKSEEDGERYTFEFNAKYVQKGSTKIIPGRADAVLNYILDYN